MKKIIIKKIEGLYHVVNKNNMTATCGYKRKETALVVIRTVDKITRLPFTYQSEKIT